MLRGAPDGLMDSGDERIRNLNPVISNEALMPHSSKGKYIVKSLLTLCHRGVDSRKQAELAACVGCVSWGCTG